MKRLAKGAQRTTPFMRLVPTENRVNGVRVKTFDPDGIVRFCNFSTYGGTTIAGTEPEVNNVIAVIDTAQVVTWFEPDITSADRIRILETGADYEIIGEPENIELRRQEMQFKVRRVKGGA